MLNNSNEIMYLVARDFVQLTPIQQVNIGLKLKLVDVGAAMWPAEEIAQTVFTKAFQAKKFPEMVKEMQKLLYE